MKQPQTVKAYLKACLIVANTSIIGMRGESKLTDEERSTIGALSADIQNDLGEMDEILQKFNLSYH